MVVHGPAAVGDDVGEPASGPHIVLGHDVVADVAAALAFAGQEADPVEGPVGGAVVGLVLDVVPDAEGDLEQFVAQAFGVVDGVRLAAQLDVPEVAAGHVVSAPRVMEGHVVGGVVVGPGRRGVGLGRRVLADLEQAAHAHGQGVGGLRLDVLAELGGRLASAAERGAGQRRQHAVAGAVGKEGGLDRVPGLRSALPALDAGQARAVHLGRIDRAVQEEFEVGLEAGRAVEHAVPDRVAGQGVAVEVFELEFLDDAGLAQVPAVGAADPHADLAGGVAAEYRPVLDEGGAGAVPGRGHGRAQSGQAAADDAEVNRVGFVAHGGISLPGTGVRPVSRTSR
ncbi:MAG: hypothetical protein BWZ02_00215 [Lentisphaerae bacterium ADurb.BinA184]|nr:MAG: hypothetical protein BWZ02_00215 [Lentisphaerae bacterium ADurb.BinA184]